MEFLLSKGYFEPFKNITIVMKDGTNAGMLNRSRVGKKADGTFNYPMGPDSVMLDNDRRFSPIILDADGLGVLPTTADDDKKIVIGVISESFTFPGHGTTTCVEGIVPMLTEDPNLTTGALVMVDTTDVAAKQGPVRIKKAATDKYAFGICLGGFKANDTVKPAAGKPLYVPVLIGTTGGWSK